MNHYTPCASSGAHSIDGTSRCPVIDDGASWAPSPLLICVVLGGLALLARGLGSDGLPLHASIGVVVIVVVASAMSALGGFAFAALATAGFALLGLGKVQAVQTLVLCSIAIQLYVVWQLRHEIDWKALRPMLAAGCCAAPAGVWILVHCNVAWFTMGAGASVAVYGACMLVQRKPWTARWPKTLDLAVGALAGLTRGITAYPGGVMSGWCAMKGWGKVRQRAVSQPFILVVQLVTIASLRWVARADLPLVPDLGHALFALFALFGAIGGFALFRRMSPRQFHVALSLGLVVSGLSLVVSVLTHVPIKEHAVSTPRRTT